jgi:hypothetical protein
MRTTLAKHHEKVGGSPSCRPTHYRAPTWSWASIDGNIGTEAVNNDGKWAINVEDYYLDYATEDTTGIVTGVGLTCAVR